MLKDLEAYLDASTTPELGTLILDATQVLLDAGVDSHLFVIRNNIDIADGLEFDTVYEGIVGALMPLLTHTLRQFGIEVSTEATLAQLTSVLKAINLIDDWDDADSLNSLVRGDEDNETMLSDVLEVVGDMPSSEYMLVLVQVSPNLIERIIEITNRDVDGPQPDEVLVAAAQMRLRALLPKAGFGEDSLFVSALDNGLRLGQSFERIIQPHLAEISELRGAAMARELVAFAYASSLASDQFLAAINELKDSFSLSITDLLQLDGEIKRLL